MAGFCGLRLAPRPQVGAAAGAAAVQLRMRRLVSACLDLVAAAVVEACSPGAALAADVPEAVRAPFSVTV